MDSVTEIKEYLKRLEKMKVKVTGDDVELRSQLEGALNKHLVVAARIKGIEDILADLRKQVAEMS